MKLFYCYSPKLKESLLDKGFRFLHKGLHDKTNKYFWVFEGSQALNDFLEVWSSRKK